MAIQTGIFKTPTGGVYNPAQQIERGFEKTAGIVTDFLGRKAADYDQQQAMFGELANNIGEIEATLQQNYAGMQQQAIDSTREWLKENIKSGKRANDPDFQMELGRRIGGIRNAMGNADKVKRQIDLEIKQIEANPYMDATGKANAVKELFDMAYNPDILIDRNPLEKLTATSKKYIDPYLVAADVYGKIPSQGSTEVLYTDSQGNERLKQVPLNDLVDPNDLFDENGRVKFSRLTPERARELLAQNQYMQMFVNEDIKRNVAPGTPEDQAIVQSLTKFMSPVAGTKQVDKLFRTREQVDMAALERQAKEKGLKLADAQINNYYSLSGSRKEYEDFAEQENKDYQRFMGFFEKSSPESIAPYLPNLAAKGYKNAKLQIEVPFTTGENQVNGLKEWIALPPDEKREYMSLVGADPLNTIPAYQKRAKAGIELTDAELSSKSIYDFFDKTRKENAQITGLKFMDSKGKPKSYTVEELGGVNGFYDFLRNTRFSGKNYVPVDPMDRSQGAVGAPGQAATSQSLGSSR